MIDESPFNQRNRNDLPFGVLLRQARESAGLTLEELATRAGLTPNAIGALERGERRYPYPATVRALSAALELSPDEQKVLMASVPKRGDRSSRAVVHPSTLPALLVPLLGRETELAAVAALLAREDVRLVTLTGPGGVGKTHLAMQIASNLADSYSDYPMIVSLAPVRDPRTWCCRRLPTRFMSQERWTSHSSIGSLPFWPSSRCSWCSTISSISSIPPHP